ncbi:hypothetical protein [Agaribacter marinus]|uniref:Uncharacterized protein n=1 Tax=Agaribacter marinus TaxID=1431249 RepID=A0AA37WGZ6_9ALTE|nr:hypothetical protein [Agaribacter marinus]GLR69288.1 hypothetical protein GCM10007852_01960 [Agaribacter marinus]
MKNYLSSLLVVIVSGLMPISVSAQVNMTESNDSKFKRNTSPEAFGATSLFSDVESFNIQLNENTFLSLQAPAAPNDIPESRSDKILNTLLKDIPVAIPFGDNYQWQHISETPSLISAYESTFRVGYSQRFRGSENAFYSLGMVWLQPSDTSISWNAVNQHVDTGSSRFLSFSFQSSF